MAEEEVKQPVTPSGEGVKPPTHHNIRLKVKDGLITANNVVRTRIVAAEVEKEIQRRVTATESVLEKIEKLESENRKVRPIPAGFSATGTPVGEPVYTKDQVDTLKKNREQLAKLEDALSKALEANSFDKVFELGGK